MLVCDARLPRKLGLNVTLDFLVGSHGQFLSSTTSCSSPIFEPIGIVPEVRASSSTGEPNREPEVAGAA